MSEQSKDEPVGDGERRRVLAGWGRLPIAIGIVVVVLVVSAVGAGGWLLGSSNDASDSIEFEEATSIGRDPFTTDGLVLASEVEAVPGPSSTSLSSTPPTQLFGGSGDQKVCDPAAIVAFLQGNPDKAKAWVAALNADPFLSWSGGRQVQVGQIAAYVAELTPSVLAVDTRVTNHGYKNGKPTARQSMLAKGTAVLIDSHRMPRVRCACGNPLLPPTGFKVASTSTSTSTSTSVEATTTVPTDDTVPTTTTKPDACGAVAPLTSDAQDVTTAPVDFDGDGTPDVLRVYRLGPVWHVRVEIAGVVIDDDVVAGPGPSMAAIGGATVDGDAFEEAWVKVGSGPPTDAVGLFTFRGCDLQRVVSDENGAPYAFDISLSSTQTFGMRCLGSNSGLEVLETTSTDGGATYSGHGQEYTLLATFSPPTMAPGMTNSYAETNSSPGFPPLHQFTCDGLGPTLP